METVKKSFREVYELELNLPRSTVQGWVKTFLDGRGYSDNSEWFFDQKEVDQLWRIRFWKQLGYKNNTIKSLLAKGSCCDKKSLTNTIKELERQRAELDNVIRVANLMQETGLTPNGIRFDMMYPAEISYDMLMEYLSVSLDDSLFIDDTEASKVLPECVFDEILNCIEIVFELFEAKVSFKSERVQELIKTVHYKCEALTSKSVFLFYIIVKSIFKNKEIACDIKEVYGEQGYKYLKQSFYWYCKQNRDNDYDKKGLESIDRIQELALKRYCTNAPEVQMEVDNLYNWYKSIKFIKEEGCYELLMRLSNIFAGEKCFKEIDKGKPRGLAWFISRALAIYCDNAKLEQSSL